MLLGGTRYHTPWLKVELWGDRPGPRSEHLRTAAVFDGARWQERRLGVEPWHSGTARLGGLVVFAVDEPSTKPLVALDLISGRTTKLGPLPDDALPMTMAAFGGTRVLVVAMVQGGATRGYVLDPATRAWSKVELPRTDSPEATALPDGSVLVLGEHAGVIVLP